jgi:MYXO-CTERM domain-containing protein
MLPSFAPRLTSSLLVLGLSLVALRVQAANFAPSCPGGVGDNAELVLALTTAASNGEADTIDLAENCVYTLTAVTSGTSGLIVVGDASTTTTLHGHGATITRAAAAPAFRVFLSDGPVEVDHLSVSNGNGPSGFDGGGWRVGSGTARFDAVRFVGNATNGFAWGGGLGVRPGATANVFNSTFSGNRAQYGAGVSSEAATLNLYNSTIAGNTAVTNGGGVYTSGGAASLNSVTVTGNQGDGGGIHMGGGTFTVLSSIVAGNLPRTGGSCDDVFGTFVDSGSNLIGAADCSTSFTTTLLKGTHAAPLSAVLSALALNGGFTETIAIAEASPAVNAGSAAACASAFIGNEDQRGVPRPAGLCDIGAFELAATPTITFTATTNPTVFGQSTTLTAHVTTAPASSVTGLTVAILEGATTVTSALTDANGDIVYTTDAFVVGTHNLTASIDAAPGVNAAVSPALALVVDKGATLTSAIASTSAISVTVAANAPAAGMPSGHVVLREGQQMRGDGTLSNGIVSIVAPTLDPGTHVLTAEYEGDDNFTGSTSDEISIVIDAPPAPADAGVPIEEEEDAGAVEGKRDAGAVGDAGTLDGISPNSSDGCGCRTASVATPRGAWAVALLFVLVLRRGSRKKQTADRH